jgi:hypothetical protein
MEEIRSALSPDGDCPSPEEYLRLESGEAAPEERRRLEDHAARCQACAAERDLARLFHGGPGETYREDMDFIVARLKELRLHETPRPLAFPDRKRTVRTWAGSLAAAAALAVALGLFLLGRQAPPLPEPGGTEVRRGTALQALQPEGEFPEMPREFRWLEAEGARSYRVTLRAVDDTVLWQATVTAPPARLPEQVARGLHPAVVYAWTVEALNERGTRLAVSEPVRFRVRLPGRVNP